MIILEPRRVIEIGRQAIDLAAESELNRLVHRTVVDDGDINLLVALLRLQLGQRVRRVAGDIFNLDAVRLFERRDHLVADRLLERAAIAGNIEGLLLGRDDRWNRGKRRDGDRCEKAERLHMDSSPMPERGDVLTI